MFDAGTVHRGLGDYVRSMRDPNRHTAAAGGSAMARRVLIFVLGFMALQALGGGAYGLAGAEGVPREWLAGSPFHDYLVPSLILVVVVGGSSIVATIALLARWPRAAHLAALAGAILLGWIVVQVAVIGYVSWLQPTVAMIAVAILGLALRVHEAGQQVA